MPINKEMIVKAVEEAKKASGKRGFTQSLDLILTLRDIDTKKPENRINELVELPHPIDKPVKVGIFATGDLAVRAKAAGVDRLFVVEDLEKLKRDKKEAKKIAKEIDFFIAEAPLMPQIATALGPILGPRGKMPTPIPPTAEIETIIERYRRMVQVKVRDQLNTQCHVGTENMLSDSIAENAQAVMARLETRLTKGLGNVRRAYIKTTMGSLVKIEI